MAGLSRSASDGSIGDESGRDALARVGFAGSFLECFAGLRGGFFGDFAIARIWASDGGEGRAIARVEELLTVVAGRWQRSAGIEWMFGSGWSAKAEYAYFDFGKIDAAGPSSVPGELYRQSVAVTAHTAKLGVNYRWDAPQVARY